MYKLLHRHVRRWFLTNEQVSVASVLAILGAVPGPVLEGSPNGPSIPQSGGDMSGPVLPPLLPRRANATYWVFRDDRSSIAEGLLWVPCDSAGWQVLPVHPTAERGAAAMPGLQATYPQPALVPGKAPCFRAERGTLEAVL